MDSHAAVLRVTRRPWAKRGDSKGQLFRELLLSLPPPPPNISLSVCDVFRYSYLPSLINYTSSCTSMKRVCKKWIQSFQLEFERTSFPRYTARFATLLFCSIMFVCLCHCYRILWSTEIWCRSESRFRRISDERNDEYARASHSQSRWWSLQTGNISLYLLVTAFNWTFSNSKGFYSHPQVVVYVLHKMKKWKWKKWENEIMGKSTTRRPILQFVTEDLWMNLSWYQVPL